MPEHPVYFRVSQEYANPDAILPVVPGNTHIRECLETVQYCMGPDRRERAGYSESHETMVTGALSKKATFATTARRSKGDDTPFYHKREVTRIQEKSPERFQERITEAGMIRNAVAQTRSDQTLQRILGDIEGKLIDEKRRIIRSELMQQNLEKDALERLATELGLQPAYRKAKRYYQGMVDEYHREHERETRRNDRILETRGMFGQRGRINYHHKRTNPSREPIPVPRASWKRGDSYPSTVPKEIQELVEMHGWIRRLLLPQNVQEEVSTLRPSIVRKISKARKSQSPDRVLVRNIRQSQYLRQLREPVISCIPDVKHDIPTWVRESSGKSSNDRG